MTSVVLIAGIPLFLAMPPWCDVTLYQMAARNILSGGVHYRDIFDTNLPGFVWAMAALRVVFGSSYEWHRAVDLIVIGAAIALLCGWVRRCGGTGYAVAWLVAAVAMFYPFTSEFSHLQRDPWMLLPAALAARMRLRRVSSGQWAVSSEEKKTDRDTFTLLPTTYCPLPTTSLLEGFLWGIAVWVKPHVVIPAFAVWAVSAVLLARREPRRRIAIDFGWLIAGGLSAGVPGIVWLIATGAWPYFLDIFLNWNPAYLSAIGSVESRFGSVFDVLRPWSILHYAALPLSVLALVEGRMWSRRPREPLNLRGIGWMYLPAANESVATARVLLAAFYLGWLGQAVLLQKTLDYAHVPLLLIAFAVVASHRWCFGSAYMVWFVAVGVAVNAFDPGGLRVKFEKHPLADRSVVKYWPRTWSEGGSSELRDKLGQYTNTHIGTNWRELNDVAAYLRTLDPPLGPGELNCWHDSTHPLYLILDLDPATRYMHYGTAFDIKLKREEIARAVRDSRQRYVVSDLLRTTWNSNAVYEARSWRNGDPLPVWLPENERRKFPWNQSVVFRSGRYVVHKIDPTKPLGTIRVPEWHMLDKLGELEPNE